MREFVLRVHVVSVAGKGVGLVGACGVGLVGACEAWPESVAVAVVTVGCGRLWWVRNAQECLTTM